MTEKIRIEQERVGKGKSGQERMGKGKRGQERTGKKKERKTTGQERTGKDRTGLNWNEDLMRLFGKCSTKITTKKNVI